MSKIQIKNLELQNTMDTLDKDIASKVLGASWHVYHNADGKVISREYEKDGVDKVFHHRP
ncbi:MAG TPA: hypothetical protein VK203_26365 [Nostocaceae cyanobacterium]|nr:hypothetical protein [Nostocaceae cyanobacterium]